MLKIGEFARLSQVSVKTLRHYDALGVLRPALVDPESGYRLYDIGQLVEVVRILALKDCGFALEEIARLLRVHDAQTLEVLLHQRIAAQERLVVDEQARLQRMIARTKQLAEADRMPLYDVALKQTEPLTLVGLRETVATTAEIGPFAQKVVRSCAQHAVVSAGPLIHLYYDDSLLEEGLDLFAGMPVTTLPTDMSELSCVRLPGGEPVACVIYRGDYPAIHGAYGALDRWLSTSPYRLAGPCREIYHRDPSHTDDPTTYITEIQYPLRPASHASQRFSETGAFTMTIPLVPFAGEMSYCLIKSLKMVLDHRGHDYPLAWLEVVSGEPFGFVYIRDKHSFFAVDGYVYHRAGEHLLQTLNYAYTYTSSPDDAAALASLEEALKSGPVVIGMLDMGYLTYIPEHQQLRGSDHAIVALALQPEAVIVHDPAGYPAVPLPLSDFLEAWKRDIYTGKPYGLWQIGEQGQPPTEKEIWQKTLARARENFAWEAEELFPGGPMALYGPTAMRTLAADLRDWPQIDLGPLPYFSWRVSGQRCQASAVFLREKLPGASAIRWEESQLYGQLQYASVARKRDALPVLLERLAELEEEFITALA